MRALPLAFAALAASLTIFRAPGVKVARSKSKNKTKVRDCCRGLGAAAAVTGCISQAVNTKAARIAAKNVLNMIPPNVSVGASTLHGIVKGVANSSRVAWVELTSQRKLLIARKHRLHILRQSDPR